VFDVDARALDENGDPLISFTGDIDAGVFSASSPIFTVEMPLGEISLVLNLYMAQIQAAITSTADGLSLTDGLIGGAAKKQDIIDALNEAKDQGLLPESINPDTLIPLLGTPDIDTDCDGTNDALSIALKFTAVPADIAGIIEREE